MRRFEFSDGKSNKFWQVSADGTSLVVTFGRIGTAGQTQAKDLGTPAAATAEMEKLVREKTKKGYAEVGEVAGAVPPAASPSPAAVVESRTAPAPSAPVAAAPPSPEPEPTSPAPAASEDAGEASTSELPRILVTRPWHDPAPVVAPPTVEGLKPLPLAERIHWDAETRARHSSPALSRADFFSMYVRRKIEPRSAEADAFVLDALYTRKYQIASWFDLLSDAGARKFFAERDLASLTPEFYDGRYLLARFGLDALDPLLSAVRADLVCSSLFEALAVVESPRVAAVHAEAAARTTKKKATALLYFASYPEASAIGILPLALGKATRKVGAPALKLLVQSGKEDVLRDVARRYGAEVSAAVDSLLAWQPAAKKPSAMPAWFAPEALPPVVLRAGDGAGKRLPVAAIVALGELLSLSEPRQPYEDLDTVIAACTPDSLARFSWALFWAWGAAGANPKEDWAMAAIGHLGGDEAARKLTPMIRAWPGESAHARAVKGLDVLAQIGTDVALMHLDRIAERVKFKGLQERAREKIAEVALERGLTPEELADRIAPTLELDADGSRVLSFGARSFRVGFDEHLAPFVVDESGKRAADLPRPRQTDDAQAAAAATELWKALKKDGKAVALGQIHRLERAMCMQRRWTVSDFKTLLVAHPLVVHLVRRLLWATYDGGVMRRLFRVAEDRTFADIEDAPFALGDGGTIGIVHRFELPDPDAARWGQVFGEYELLQPFAQLEREVYPATDDERSAKALKRTDGVEVPTAKILGLEARGWSKGAAQDAGWIWDVYKTLPGGLVASLPLEGGLLAGDMRESPPAQKLGALVVRRSGQWNGPPIALGEIPPLVFSELVRDVEGLRA